MLIQPSTGKKHWLGHAPISEVRGPANLSTFLYSSSTPTVEQLICSARDSSSNIVEERTNENARVGQLVLAIHWFIPIELLYGSHVIHLCSHQPKIPISGVRFYDYCSVQFIRGRNGKRQYLYYDLLQKAWANELQPHMQQRKLCGFTLSFCNYLAQLLSTITRKLL